MNTAWSHLPNALPIDRVLASIKVNPTAWALPWDHDAWSDAWSDAARLTSTCAMYFIRDSAWSAVWDATRLLVKGADTRSAISGVAEGAIAALISYDNCAYLLDSEPQHVKLMALLGSHPAMLLYPACLAMGNKMEIL